MFAQNFVNGNMALSAFIAKAITVDSYEIFFERSFPETGKIAL